MIVKLMNEFTKFYYYFHFIEVGENHVKDNPGINIDHHLIFFSLKYKLNKYITVIKIEYMCKVHL